MSSKDEKKGPRPPYASRGAVDAFFAKIQGLRDPGTIDGAWAKNYGLDASLPAAIPSMLTWLGVTDANGKTDSSVWDKLRVPASRAEALTGLLQESYKEIFSRLDLDHATREHVNNAFIQGYGTGNLSRPIGCFLALCAHAGIDIGPANGEKKKTESKAKTRPKTAARADAGGRTRRRQEPSKDGGDDSTKIAIQMNVEIPAEWSEDQIRERLDLVRRVAEDEQAGA
jgi:Family of unknown function (DUF5343)